MGATCTGLPDGYSDSLRAVDQLGGKRICSLRTEKSSTLWWELSWPKMGT
jgi:hypothetical protein